MRSGGALAVRFMTKAGRLEALELPATDRHKVPGFKYVRYDEEGNFVGVNDLISKYGVFRTRLTTEADRKLGIEGLETAVRELASGETLATHRVIANTKTARVCGSAVDGKIDEKRFVLRALGLNSV